MGNSCSTIIAGFGGQGILFAGKQLALAGMYTDKKVTWMPSYGPEMKGGTSNCTVIISDGDIGSPILQSPNNVVAMNLPSYLKFHVRIVPGGTLICDSSLVSAKCERNDINTHEIPATAIAYELDIPKFANVIMLGKLAAATGIFTLDELIMSIQKSLSDSKKELAEMNIKALKAGFGHK